MDNAQIRRTGGLIGACVLSTITLGQIPTLSVELTEVNSVPLAEPVSEITVSPGDVLVAKIYARDWSPDGEKLRAVQMSLDSHGFTSGFTGNIMPVDYETLMAVNEENKANAYIDTADPMYPFRNIGSFAVTDTRSPGYRWLSVITDGAEAIPCKQGGTRYPFATVRLKVSDDASGPFTLALLEEPAYSSLRDPTSKLIIPLDFEKLQVHVATGTETVRLTGSIPPSGTIDARKPLARRGETWFGTQSIPLSLTGDLTELTTDDFRIEDGTADPPRINRIIKSGDNVSLELDRGLRAGRWTKITHFPSNTSTRIGYLPGDVNGDGFTNERDVFALMAAPDSAEFWPTYRVDLDGDGVVAGVRDALCVLDLLTEPRAYRAALAR